MSGVHSPLGATARIGFAFAPTACALLTACVSLRPFTAPAPGETATETIDVDGWTRTYRLHAPASGGSPRALVVVLHGGGDDAKGIEDKTGFSRIADRSRFAVAYPNGLGIAGWAQMWNVGHCCGRAQMLGVDDVGFVRSLVGDLSARLHVPADRVFVVGYSNGALLAYRAATLLADRIGGIAIFAGTMRARGPREAPRFEVRPARPIAVFAAHGTADTRIPMDGQEDGAFVDVSMQQAGRFWAVVNGCRARPIPRLLRNGALRIEAYRGCPAVAPVVTVTIAGWDHEWPGAADTASLAQNDPLRGFDLGAMMEGFLVETLDARDAPPKAPRAEARGGVQ